MPADLLPDAAVSRRCARESLIYIYRLWWWGSISEATKIGAHAGDERCGLQASETAHAAASTGHTLSLKSLSLPCLLTTSARQRPVAHDVSSRRQSNSPKLITQSRR